MPASGPAPVIIRFDDWMVIGSDYERLSFEMETDAPMVKQLGKSTWGSGCSRDLAQLCL